jgi:uncharacterized tellurite resistance protein B-like protein
MSTWLGALAKGGVIGASPGSARSDDSTSRGASARSEHEEAGEAVAAFVVGDERLEELRRWWGTLSPEDVAREKNAAIEICIWMANADRRLDPEEAHMLRAIILESGLDEDAQDELVAAVDDPPSLAAIEERLTHPVLRELLLALAWELAAADGEIDLRERDFHVGLALRLGIDQARAREIRESISAEIENNIAR